MSSEFTFHRIHDTHRYVYHFTTAEAAFDKILPNRNIRFSPFVNVNDPRDAKDWQIALVCPQGSALPMPKEVGQSQECVNQMAKSRSKLLCMSSDEDFAGPDVEIEFYRGYGHARLWAQYAQNHKGVCLVFDRVALDLQIREQLGRIGSVFAGQVNYVNAHRREVRAFQLRIDEVRKRQVEEIVLQHVLDFHDVFFFQKSRDWSQEAEWRWVVIGRDADPIFVSFGSSLVAVIRGADHRNTRDSYRLLHDLGVKLGIMTWCNGIPGVCEYWTKDE